MAHPEKWRETADIAALPLGEITVEAVLGYPHAGNDVFHVRATHRGRPVTAFIKVERQPGADIAREVGVLSALSAPYVPTVLAYSLTPPRFMVTGEMPGRRLSALHDQHPHMDIPAYLARQGALLAEIHTLSIPCGPVADRRFFHLPGADHWAQHGLDSARAFLAGHAPKGSICFVHGDFHYANLLWQYGEISAVLDYELSGLGIREFDMAWAIFLRPGQRFARDFCGVEAFLSGYRGPYSRRAFLHYYVQIAAHFYPMGDADYRRDVRALISAAVNSARRE